MTQNSGGAASSGLKRDRDALQDGEEHARPTHFQAVDEKGGDEEEDADVQIDLDDGMDGDSTVDLENEEMNVNFDEIPRAPALGHLGPVLGQLGVGENMRTKKEEQKKNKEHHSREANTSTQNQKRREANTGKRDSELNNIANKHDDIANENLSSTSRRSKNKESKYAVCEAFTPPRICPRARSRGVAGGWSLDIKTVDPITGAKYDLRDSGDQRKVIQMLHRDRPEVLMVCPPCTLFSALQNLTGDPETRRPDEWRQAVAMVEFGIELCRIQMRGGRTFIFEHPLTATSWRRTNLKELMKTHGVLQVVSHMCAYGMTATDAQGVGQVLKPTRYLTNCSVMAEKLSYRCSRDHRHVHLMNGRAAAASAYPEGLVDSIIDAIEIKHLKNKELHGLEIKEYHDADGWELHEPEDLGGRFIDDSTGQTLDPIAVKAARDEELKTFEQMKVYEYVKMEKAMCEPDAKRIGVRWVDINKGPKVRSRLVAQEFARGDPNREDLFAGTPPLGATKMLLSDLASNGRGGPGGKRLMVLDVKRAFLYGDIEEKIFVDLPEEDPMKSRGYCGRLRKAMYGTRAAPVVWQKLVRETMHRLGFTSSKKFPCIYHHVEKDIKVLAHVDDFLCTGELSHLQWILRELSKEFEMTHEVLGPGHGEKREVKFLGRLIQWKQTGLAYQGDPSHARILLDEWQMDQSRPVGTPGIAEEKHDKIPELEAKKLSPEAAKTYRRAAARLNYMAQDRADLSFAAKEASRGMSSPSEGDIVRLKRILRYIQGSPVVVTWYQWQERSHQVLAFSDSDWAGDQRTRKSTSGGVLMYGAHLVAHWSSTQATIALSVGEAELNAAVKATIEAIGARDMLKDFGHNPSLEVRTDSAATKGIAGRDGCAKLKHLSCKQLWLQTMVQRKVVHIVKVPRAVNHADALTHHWTPIEGATHFPKVNLRIFADATHSGHVRGEGG